MIPAFKRAIYDYVFGILDSSTLLSTLYTRIYKTYIYPMTDLSTNIKIFSVWYKGHWRFLTSSFRIKYSGCNQPLKGVPITVGDNLSMDYAPGYHLNNFGSEEFVSLWWRQESRFVGDLMKSTSPSFSQLNPKYLINGKVNEKEIHMLIADRGWYRLK